MACITRFATAILSSETELALDAIRFNNNVVSFCEECVLWHVFGFYLTAPYSILQSHPSTTRGNRQLSLAALAGRPVASRSVKLPLLPNTRSVLSTAISWMGDHPGMTLKQN